MSNLNEDNYGIPDWFKDANCWIEIIKKIDEWHLEQLKR